jgi:hypothetical protein
MVSARRISPPKELPRALNVDSADAATGCTLNEGDSMSNLLKAAAAAAVLACGATIAMAQSPSGDAPIKEQQDRNSPSGKSLPGSAGTGSGAGSGTTSSPPATSPAPVDTPSGGPKDMTKEMPKGGSPQSSSKSGGQ